VWQHLLVDLDGFSANQYWIASFVCLDFAPALSILDDSTSLAPQIVAAASERRGLVDAVSAKSDPIMIARHDGC